MSFRNKILILLSFILIALTISQFLIFTDQSKKFTIKGNFDPKLSRIKTINDAVDHIKLKSQNSDSLILLQNSFDFLSNRFFHGTQRIEYQNNCLAYILSSFWGDLNMEVNEQNLIKGKVLVCNQASILSQSVLKKMGFNTRSVHFNKHFSTEVFVNGNWYIFDPDYEPKFKFKSKILNGEHLIHKKKEFVNAYKHVKDQGYNENYIDFLSTKKITYSYKKPATLLLTFQNFLWCFSWFGWVVPIVLIIILNYVKRKIR